MRTALQDRPRKIEQVGIPTSVPAPFGGWNTRDSLAEMPPTDAIIMDNFTPFPGRVVTRKGATDHVTGFASTKEVESLLPYKKQDGTAKLFAATEDGIYDVTVAGVVGAAVVAGTNGRWQSVNFANSATNSWLIAVNGVDQLQEYNGTTWTGVANFTASFPTTDIIGVEVYKQRLYFVPKNKLEFWFLPAGAVTGTADRFGLGQIFRRGGFLMAIVTWTVDAGEGSDDFLVCISSEGEVAVFTGDDPASVLTWQKVGVFYIGRPLGRRPAMKWGGDVLLLTDRGLFPLTKALQSATVDKTIALTDKIEPTFIQQASTYFTEFGWEITANTKEALILVNVPSTPPVQYVMHVQSQGWCQWRGWSPNCWAYFEGEWYYGMLQKVAKAYTGPSDFGDAIIADCVPAFNYFGTRGREKHLKLLRPFFISDGPFDYTLGCCVDYVVRQPTITITGTATPVALWDVAEWDVGFWTTDEFVTKDWRTVEHYPGFAITPYIRISTTSIQAAFIVTDYLFEGGGVL